ncbi:MAG TPA: PEP-CTERM sorting domain-containing protein, partial [Tepidisphaeraceae bacterium]|nr:PEP-CTERM sorting domain-containing protein [Tepidisphaeraceae bacterium]
RGLGGLYNEAILSAGDSRGGVFIKDGTNWKLAGINKSVESFFSSNGAWGSGFNASVSDAGGLYFGGDGKWRLVPDGAADVQASSYATRISSNMTWIRSVLGSSLSMSSLSNGTMAGSSNVPEPGVMGMMLFVMAGLIRRRGR